MKGLVIAGWLALLCCRADAAGQDATAVEATPSARITIDGGGHVTALDWQVRTPVVERIADRLTPLVQAWEFTPATRDGRAVETSTGLFVHVVGEEAADGSMDLRVDRVSTGVMSLRLQPANYPIEVQRDFARGNTTSAVVVADIEVAANGKAIVRGLDYKGTSGKRHRPAFERAVEQAAGDWVFVPEIVDGVASPARMRIPMSFCTQADMAWCERTQAQMMAGYPADETATPRSEVALKTDFRAARIHVPPAGQTGAGNPASTRGDGANAADKP